MGISLVRFNHRNRGVYSIHQGLHEYLHTYIRFMQFLFICLVNESVTLTLVYFLKNIEKNQ